MNRISGKPLLLSFIIIISFSIKLAAQKKTIGGITISSPTAASLGKFGDIPVSYHTGIPNIDIPIYTIKSGPLELPISLSYYAGGLKVQEQASWIGAGWNLNAGGVITRTVIGSPDDRGLFGQSADRGHYTHYGYSSYLFSEGPQSCGGNGPFYCPTGTIYAPQDNNIQSGVFDGEPDLYFFNFNGHSGKFYFNDDRTPVFVPQEDLKVEPIYTGTDSRGMTGFIITTNDGTRYYFGQNQNGYNNIDAIEYSQIVSVQAFANTNHGAVSSWYLNKIVSADGLFNIVLSYTEEKYTYYTLPMFPIPAIPNPNPDGYNLEYGLIKNFVTGVRLCKITFANGQIDFNAGSLRQDLIAGNGYRSLDELSPASTDPLGARVLDNISILSNTGSCKKYIFYTSYFYDGSPLTGELFTTTWPNLNLQSDKYRLRLDALKETSCDNSIALPAYKFSYFQEPVPRKLNFGIDHWGFYNGVTNNKALIPTFTIIDNTNTVITKPGANRDASWPAMRGGALQKIDYPTGGNTVFDFEPNTLFTSQSTSSLNPVLGLSIHQTEYGQQTSFFQTLPLTGSGNFQINASNTSPFPANLVIRDAGNTAVKNIYVTENSNYETIINLAQGTYQVTLSLPENGNIAYKGGAQATFKQWQTTDTRQNQMVGGLRIKTITNNDALTNQPVITSYTYNFNNDLSNDGRSSGRLYSRPVYVQGLRNDAWAIVGASCSSIGCFACFGSDVSYYKSPSSIRPMATTQGNHIGYAEVRVTQSGNGYTVYKYYSNNGSIPNISDPIPEDVCMRKLSTFCDPGLPNSPAAPDPFDPMRGELLSQAVYRQDGTILSVSKFIPTYRFDAITTPGIISTYFITGYRIPTPDPANPPKDGEVPVPGEIGIPTTVVPVGISTFTEYNLRSARKIRDTKTTDTYDLVSGNMLSVTTTTEYGGKLHMNPTMMSTTNSKGQNLVSYYTNALDYEAVSFNPDPLIATYNTNVANDLADLNRALLAVAPTYWGRLNQYTNYRYQRVAHRQSFINSMINLKNTYLTNLQVAKNNADENLKPILELQNQFQNPVIQHSEWKDNKLVNADFMNYIIGDNTAIYPGKLELINLAQPATGLTNSIVSGTTLIKDARFKDESSFKFDNGNLVQVNDKGGLVTSYLFGYNKTYPIAKVIGADFNSLLSMGINPAILNNADGTYTDQQIRDELNKIRTGLAGTGAQVFTYTYKPLIGIVSETDPAGRTMYYEYDSIKRLKLIRDKNKNIIKQFCYNYAGQPENCAGSTIITTYSNVLKSGIYTRNNCPSGGVGSSVTYTVPTGAYSSTVSQADADQKAQNDVNSNGQAYANTNGSCTISTTYSNVLKSGIYTRNNCPSGSIGSSVTYTVPTGAYSSTVSQADADQKAQNDVNANGQTYANANGTCTASNVSVTLVNSANAFSYRIVFTKNGVDTQFNFPSSGSATISVTAGVYDVSIAPIGGAAQTRTFRLISTGTMVGTQTGVSATFANINVGPGLVAFIE